MGWVPSGWTWSSSGVSDKRDNVLIEPSATSHDCLHHSEALYIHCKLTPDCATTSVPADGNIDRHI